MTLSRRIIACLDVANGRTVKGTAFIDLRDVGDPIELAERYEHDGADEVVFLDISASAEERATLLDLASRAAERLFIPLVIGGGVRSVNDVRRALRAGADKVGINSAAVRRPELLTEAAEQFGSQCVVASIDAKRVDEAGTVRWQVFVEGGRRSTNLDAIEWAARCAALGAGEILLTSIDRDGSRCGYDIELTRAVAAAIPVPVIASGGAGTVDHVIDVFRSTGADAALLAGILHDRTISVPDIKRVMARDGIPVRSAA